MARRTRRPAARITTTNTRPVRPGLVSARRDVPASIPRPEYADRGYPIIKPPADPRQDGETIERMRLSGRAARRVLTAVAAEIAPGVTTEHLDEVAHAAYIAEGGYPSPLNYNGYPKSLCTSVNEVICHGIPDSRKLEDGDIVNCDVTIFLDWVHGDHSETFLVGEVDDESKRLVTVTRECLYLGIGAVTAGGPLNAIGKAIQDHAEANGFGVVREFIGHGTGPIFHMPPNVTHYFDPRNRATLEAGMTFTIEPMITAGNWRAQMWDDYWTATTVDLSRTAQFEHTMVIHPDGVELLTVGADEPQPFMPGNDRNVWPSTLPNAQGVRA